MSLSPSQSDSTAAIFTEAKLSQMAPTGWLAAWLRRQIDGLTGHLDVAGFPFDTELWACDEIAHQSGAPWWPYEQTAYWVDAMVRCGKLVEDGPLLHRGEQQCRYVLDHSDREGYLGPISCRSPMVAGRWSHSIFFRALMAYADLGHEEEVATALSRHFLGHEHDHSGHRDVCCIEAMYWAYQHTREPALLEMAEETWQRFQEDAHGDDRALTADALACNAPADCHGVTFCETLKLPALLYLATGKEAYLQQARDGFRKLDRHHMLVTGAPSSTESLRGFTPLDAHETCDIADYTWAAGYMLQATGEAAFADQIERACFNALPGAVTKDFRALQYFSCPNQVVLMENSTHTLAAAGGKFMTYRPRPGTECCTGQVNRPMPNYVARQWMWRNGEPSATFYGPSIFTFERDGQSIRIEEATSYPFSETIRFTVTCTEPVRFTLWLRIPGWCENAAVAVNSEPEKDDFRSGTFFPLTRKWSPGDVVELSLPMKIRLQRWPEDGISIERGPLVFALPVADERRPDPNDPHQNEAFPAWGMKPVSPWNYGLALNETNLAEEIQIEETAGSDDPWSHSPIRLRLSAHRIEGWSLRATDAMDSVGGELVDPARNLWRAYEEVIHGDFLLTPHLPEASLRASARERPAEAIELVPIGCTCLRLTIFPELRTTDA
jgi:hypothetical protein